MLVKRLKKLVALVFGLAGVAMLWQGGGFIWLGFFSLIIGLLVLVRPDGAEQGDSAALAEYENLRHGHPSRDTTRSDYFLNGPTGGGGPGDGGAV
ncbi:MAG TPA: hypothetical protein VLS27_17725 [Gammaproteobacteria bacterium]|nr:hypothetical protein [Gammaproteobacteria bacterium]